MASTDAVRAAEAEVRQLERSAGPGHMSVAEALQRLADRCGEAGDAGGERRALERAMAALSFHVGLDDERAVRVRERLAELGPSRERGPSLETGTGAAGGGAAGGSQALAALGDGRAINQLAAALSERWAGLPQERKDAVFRAKDAQDREALEVTVEELREDRASLNRQLHEASAAHARRTAALEERHRAEAAEAEAEVQRLQDLLDEAGRRQKRAGSATPRARAELKELRAKLDAAKASAARKIKRARAETAEARQRADAAERRAKALAEDKRRLERSVAALKSDGPSSLSDAACMARAVGVHLDALRTAAGAVSEQAAASRRDAEARADEMSARAEELRGTMDALAQSAEAMKERAEALERRLAEAERASAEERERAARELEEARAAQREADRQLLVRTHELKLQEARHAEARKALELQNEGMGESIITLVQQLEELESAYLELQSGLADSQRTSGTQTGVRPARRSVGGPALPVRPPWNGSARTDT